MGQRAQRKLQERQFLIITGDPVGAQGTAPGTAMDQSPLAILANIDPDRLHR